MDDANQPRLELEDLMKEALEKRGWTFITIRNRRLLRSPDSRLDILRDACTLGEIWATVSQWKPQTEAPAVA